MAKIEFIEPVKVEVVEANYYEEWFCLIGINEKNESFYEKMKIKRPRVVISEEEAFAINDGRLHGGNLYAELYFKPENK